MIITKEQTKQIQELNYTAIIKYLPENNPNMNDYLITFPDFKNLVTEGKNLEHAKLMADECLSLELHFYLTNNLKLPKAIKKKKSNYIIYYPVINFDDFDDIISYEENKK